MRVVRVECRVPRWNEIDTPTSSQADFHSRLISALRNPRPVLGLMKTNEYLRTKVPGDIVDVLSSAEMPRTFSNRYAYSNLGLLISDWHDLPTAEARRGLIRELFFPASESLKSKYGKSNNYWLPWLWIRQVFGGLAHRLTLR